MNMKSFAQTDHSKSTDVDSFDRTQQTQQTQPDNQIELFPIVGIGASAGGLEAFTQLLSNLPIDTGMGFVLVQHLDPNHKSLLTEILSKTTQMPVSEVKDGMVVEPNHVYVIPPNTTMMLSQGGLRLTPRAKNRRPSMSVDGFFNSLAADRGAKSIGVVLSGGDGDGSKGLEAIKSAGGITFAQSENTAQVSSMPTTAISTGDVDFILPPEEIAKKLADISRHPYVTSLNSIVRSEQSSDDGTDALSTIFSLLQTTARIDFTHYKHTTIKRRIFRRMALYRLEQLEDYVRYLHENPAEVQALYQEILINVTSFFRDPDVFETLKREVFPAILHDRSADLPIRIWVAGCSTGEEAYSIAICLLEFFTHQPRKPQIQIFATDISERAIEKARLGIYQQSQVSDISPERLQRFFTQVEGGYQINKVIREFCIFARQNLIGDPPFSRLDLISCRNVLIYFGSALQKKVLPIFHYGLNPTGFLLLGASETVGGLSDLFTVFDRKFKIYTKRPSAGRLSTELIASSSPIVSANLQSIVVDKDQNETELHKAADRIVLNQYAPVGVVIDAQLEILQFRGQTGAYLEPSPGRASLNLLNMAKAGLRLELQAAINEAKQTSQATRKEEIPLSDRDRDVTNSLVRTRQVAIDVIPFKSSGADRDYFLVLFETMPVLPSEEELPSRSNQSKRKKQSSEQQENQRLQQDLDTTKIYLQSIIEEQQTTNEDLRAANEEVLSSNEELQSTNEELQTAKEEIQTSNEELSTINDELYRRNSEATNLGNDFQNLLSSINIPILMLEGDLRIRRFTPTAVHLFNLIPTDIGRPLSDIKHNLIIDNLEQQILEVIETLNLKTLEIQDRDGHWYDLRIRPYRTLDNRIDGAVVVLVEIDALKHSADQIVEARDYAEAIVQTVRESLVVLNEDLQVVTATQMFYSTFQVSPSETEQCQIFALGNGQWNISKLRSLLEDLLTHSIQVQDFTVVHNFANIGEKTMLLNARKMPPLEGKQMILLSIEDISDRAQPAPKQT